jgi:integrase
MCYPQCRSPTPRSATRPCGCPATRAERNPATDIRGALPPGKEKHHAAIMDPKAIGALLRAIDGYQGSFVTQCALRLAPRTFVRPGELRKPDWSEFDLEAAEWRIPAERMRCG